MLFLRAVMCSKDYIQVTEMGEKNCYRTDNSMKESYFVLFIPIHY